MSFHPPSDDPLVTAARALARRDRGWSAEESQALQRWCDASPAHAAAVAQIEAAWRRLDLLSSLRPRSDASPQPDLLLGEDNRPT